MENSITDKNEGFKKEFMKEYFKTKEKTLFFDNLRSFLEKEFQLDYKNTWVKIVESDEEIYDKELILKLNEDVSPQRLDDLLSEAISKGANFSKKRAF